MPHAQVENKITCAHGECVQPGTVEVKLGTEIIEFCEGCAERREQIKG